MSKTFIEQFIEALEHGITHKAIFLAQFMKNEINELYDYRSPLSWASRYGNEKVAQALREMGAVEEVDKKGMSDELIKILDIDGIYEIDEKRAIELIKNGANLEKKDHRGYTALISASREGHIEIVKALLSSGAKVDEKEKFGYTALMYASYYGKFEVVKALLDAGAKVDEKYDNGGTALILASSHDNVEVVKALLGAGADATITDNNGKTAIDYTVNDKIKKMLNDAMKKPKEKQNEQTLREMEAIELIKEGGNIDKKDEDGCTVLMWASRNGKVEVVEALLSRGAKVDEKDNDGKTALIWASREGHIEVVKALLDAGAKVDEKDNDAATALMEASGNGDVEVVKTLLDAGATETINEKDNDGDAALIWASWFGRLEVVKTLLSRGAKVDEKNNDGKIAIDYTSNDEIKKLLNEAMRKHKVQKFKNKISALFGRE